MNKTIYIKNDQASIWNRARELADNNISAVIIEALKKFIADKEAAACKECGRP